MLVRVSSDLNEAAGKTAPLGMPPPMPAPSITIAFGDVVAGLALPEEAQNPFLRPCQRDVSASLPAMNRQNQ